MLNDNREAIDAKIAETKAKIAEMEKVAAAIVDAINEARQDADEARQDAYYELDVTGFELLPEEAYLIALQDDREKALFAAWGAKECRIALESLLQSGTGTTGITADGLLYTIAETDGIYIVEERDALDDENAPDIIATGDINEAMQALSDKLYGYVDADELYDNIKLYVKPDELHDDIHHIEVDDDILEL